MRKPLLAAMAVALSLFTLNSCSKDDDGPSGGGNGKKAKITFSVSSAFNKAEGDDFSVGVGAWNSGGFYVDWKVDGKTEKGTVVTVGSDYVNGGKSNVVVESVQDFASGSVSISSFNISGAPFTVTYKVEVDGEIIDEKTVEVSADDADPLHKNYTL